MTFQVKVNSGGGRSAGKSLLIVPFVLVSICGCSPSYENSRTEPPTLPALSSAADAPIKQVAESFIKAVQSGDYRTVSSFSSSEFQKKMPVPELSQMRETGSLKPLVSSGQVKFEPVHLNRDGSRATVRLSFDSSDQKNYKMNLVLKKNGQDWKIDTLVPPVTRGKPMVSGGSVSAPK